MDADMLIDLMTVLQTLRNDSVDVSGSFKLWTLHRVGLAKALLLLLSLLLHVHDIVTLLEVSSNFGIRSVFVFVLIY